MLGLKCRGLGEILEKGRAVINHGDMGEGTHAIGEPRERGQILESKRPEKVKGKTKIKHRHPRVLEETDPDEEAQKVSAGTDAAEKKELNRGHEVERSSFK